MTKLDIYRRHFAFTSLLLIALGFFGFFSIKATWFVVGYPTHQGHEPGVFGWPIPLQHSLFYAFYWTAGFFGVFLLLLLRKSGWILTQIIILSGTTILFLAILMSVFTPLEYLDIKYVSVLIVACLLLLLLNSNSLLNLISVRRAYNSYKPILLGILLLTVLAVFVFDIFSVVE